MGEDRRRDATFYRDQAAFYRRLSHTLISAQLRDLAARIAEGCEAMEAEVEKAHRARQHTHQPHHPPPKHRRAG